MGHERVGALPRSKRWLDVVQGIAEASSVDGDVQGLANATLRNVRKQLLEVPADTGFVASFEFLLGLALSADPRGDKAPLGRLAIDLDANPSPLKLARALAEYVADKRQSTEYAEIARKAATDVIAAWTGEQTRQLTITGDHERSSEVWRKASDGRGFCEVSRLFFGKFVERYLNYFIGREASGYLATTEDRERLARRLPECDNEVDLVERVWSLCARHGGQVRESLRRMRNLHEDVFTPREPGCLLDVVSDREFLKAPIERLVRSIEEHLDSALPKSFRTQDPVNEADLNDKIEGLLDTERDDLRREHPAIPFATAGVRPDFTLDKAHLLIEGKYIRGSTTPAKVTEGMSADLIKYPEEAHILFVVYDPGRAVGDRSRFRKDFESKGRCTVCILP